MKQSNPKVHPGTPPLVPQSAAAWFLPLARATLPAVVLAASQAMHAVLRQGQELSGTVAR